MALTLLLAAGEHKWFQLLFPTWVLLVSVVILFTHPQRPEGDVGSRLGPANVDSEGVTGEEPP